MSEMTERENRRDDTPLSDKLESIGDAIEVVVATPFLIIAMAISSIAKAPWMLASAISRLAAR